MGSAFQCDACKRLQEGEPVQRVNIVPKHGVNVSEEWCDQCIASFSDWRHSRNTTTADGLDIIGGVE